MSILDRLIDQACGFRPGELPPAPKTVIMSCPDCGETKSSVGHASDPPDTFKIVFPCPGCGGGDIATPRYFDAAGQELALDLDGAQP